LYQCPVLNYLNNSQKRIGKKLYQII
ncbi:MAG: transketolase, partial [Spiroplasma phoeniceum]